MTVGEFYDLIFPKGGARMAELTGLNIKIDCNLKLKADTLFDRMDMTLSTAVKANQALRDIQEQSVINNTSEMSIEEIDAEIVAYRQEKRCCNAKNS